MLTAAKNSLVLTDFSSLKRFADLNTIISYGGFYQVLRSTLIREGKKEYVFRQLGEGLIALAEEAHVFRRMDVLEQISQMLVRLPRQQYEDVGHYYEAVCIQKLGWGDLSRAAEIITPIAERGPQPYRARALISLGANSINRGDSQSALSRYSEASCLASRSMFADPYIILHTQKMFSFIIGGDGDHRRASASLESLFPLANSIRSSYPHAYYDYLNSLAVELCEVGRLEEARNISQIVLASPFAPAYPEWSETNDEIARRSRRASRSVVAFTGWISEAESATTPDAGNLVRLVASQRSASPPDSAATRATQRASVVNLLEWKNEVTERKTTFKNRQTRLKELKKLPTEDKIAEIWGRLGDEDVDDDLLCEALLILEDYQPEENQGS